MASRPKKNSPDPKLEGIELWRRGVSRLVEQGRLMWMLGEGFSAALTAHAQGWMPSDEESLTTEVFGWMQQAWSSPRGSRNTQVKPQTSASSTARKTRPLNSPGLTLMRENLSDVNFPVVWIGSQEIGGQWASMAIAAGVDGPSYRHRGKSDAGSCSWPGLDWSDSNCSLPHQAAQGHPGSLS